MTLTREHFEARYAADPDPWDFEGSAYERAKYERTLAALDERRYASAFEAGCSIGVFTAMLADRCDELLAVDIAQSAVEATRRRLGSRAHVGVERRTLPEQWPAGPFDLVVCSEILYYWDRPTLERRAARDRRIAGARRPPGRRALPAALDHRSADGRCRPRHPARATGPRTRAVRGQRQVPHRRLRRMRPGQRIVIVGGGPAALATARSYREAGGEASVELIGAEPHLPYQRPPLTKELLRGELEPADLPLEDEPWFAAHAVTLRRARRAVALDRRGARGAPGGRPAAGLRRLRAGHGLRARTPADRRSAGPGPAHDPHGGRRPAAARRGAGGRPCGGRRRRLHRLRGGGVARAPRPRRGPRRARGATRRPSAWATGPASSSRRCCARPASRSASAPRSSASSRAGACG